MKRPDALASPGQSNPVLATAARQVAAQAQGRPRKHPALAPTGHARRTDLRLRPGGPPERSGQPTPSPTRLPVPAAAATQQAPTAEAAARRAAAPTALG